ncbi:MAG TPA: hypothetical protein VMU08_03720 [Rhizomicrobium sp.]|nr:hypothetical protein [Rhizomicrobium sp.]
MPGCRKALAATLVSATALAPALADSYTNARFGYTLTYPAGVFAPQPEAENGDGRHFTALHGAADLAVWGAYNALDQSASDIANGVASNCAPAPQPYRLIKPTVVVVSCSTANGILYHKTYIRGDVLTSFELTYPASDKVRWDAVAGKLRLTPAK